MKIKFWWNWGYAGPWGIKTYRPYVKSCDELCNPVYQFFIPWVAALEFRTEKVKFTDGLWTTSSSNGRSLGVYTYGDPDKMILARIPMSTDEIDKAFGNGEEHPKIWSDSEVLARADKFELYDDDVDDFIEITRNELLFRLGRNQLA
jgi:hypothetical protein